MYCIMYLLLTANNSVISTYLFVGNMFERETSVTKIQNDDKKRNMLKYLNIFLLTEVKDKLDFLHIKTFTPTNIDKLVKSLQCDLDLHIDEKKDKTSANRKLLISTICELITALKKIKGGRSGDGQSGSLTKLDEDIKKVFWNFFTAKDDKQPGEDSVDGGEQLATTVNEAPIRVSNIFERCDIGAIQRVIKKMPPVPVTKPGSLTAPESEQSAVQRIALAIRSEPRAPVAKPPVQPDTTPAAGPAPPTGKVRKDHISRLQKESESRLKRRHLHPKGLRDTSATMVEEALKINPVIGAVAEQARQILQEDRWDVFGKSIAQLSAVAYQDELELMEHAGKILLKIAADAKTAGTD
ncbi:uncharacterized protein LOC134817116 [Bolinopsis microptera]|uniref:uncharacterized protein LOC134811241 n=3 Tax=Bolinopsis microptera TaxID=2820187 RepID=UPI00307AA384